MGVRERWCVCVVRVEAEGKGMAYGYNYVIKAPMLGTNVSVVL